MLRLNENELIKNKNSPDFYKETTKLFDQRRRELCLDVRRMLEERDISGAAMNQIIQSENKVYFQNMICGDKFTLPPNKLVIFSQFFVMSCHELLFGHRKATMLPKDISGMIQIFRSLKEETKKIILDHMSAITSKGPNYHSNDSRMISSVNHTRLVRIRLKEAARDRGVNVFSRDLLPSKMRTVVQRYIIQEDGYEASQNILMMMALCLETTVDYLCRVDYTDVTEMRLFDSDDLIKEKSEIKFIKEYLAAQYQDERNEGYILQELLLLHWKDVNGLLVSLPESVEVKVLSIFNSMGLSMEEGTAILYNILSRDERQQELVRNFYSSIVNEKIGTD